MNEDTFDEDKFITKKIVQAPRHVREKIARDMASELSTYYKLYAVPIKYGFFIRAYSKTPAKTGMSCKDFIHWAASQGFFRVIITPDLARYLFPIEETQGLSDIDLLSKIHNSERK